VIRSSNWFILFCLAVCSFTSQAATPQPDLKPQSNATIASRFEYTLGAVFLKPGASNLNYVIYNNGLPLQSPSWTEKEIQPTYSAGFDLGVRYLLPTQLNQDVNLTWTHLSTRDSTSVTAGPGVFLGPDYQIDPNAIPIRAAQGIAKFKYDVANLDVGQSIYFGDHLQIRFFGGLSTGFLREDVNAIYSGNVIVGPYQGPFVLNQLVSSNYTGIGPRLGLFADYETDSGFGVSGEAAVSGLIGTQNTKTSYTASSQQLLSVYSQAQNSQYIVDEHVYQAIPGFDGRVALSYKHAVGATGFVKMTAGYEAAVYVNAISQYLPQTLVDSAPLQTGGIFVATMSHTLSNYSVQGPFLNVTLAY
jgi:hypothetical protein